MATKSKNIQINWTQKEVDTLREMWIQGRSAKEISPFVAGRGEPAIWRKVKRLKLNRPYVKKLKNIATFKDLRGAPKKVTPYVEPEFTGGKPLVDLKRFECHYPHSGQIYCGEPTNAAYGYCRHHHELCYRPIKCS